MVGGDGHLVHQVAGDEDRLALGRELLHQVPDPQHAFRVQPVDRLVEQQHLRVAEHRGRDAEPLAHAERETARPLARHVLQPDQGEHLVNAGPWQALSLGQEQQVIAGAAARVHRLGLQQRADGAQRVGQVAVVAAVNRRRAPLRPVQAEDQPHGGGLAGAVGPEEAGDLTRGDGERQVIDRRLVAVTLGEVTCFDHVNSSPGRDDRTADNATLKRSKLPQPGSKRFPAAACRHAVPSSSERAVRSGASHGLAVGAGGPVT